jgi:hypothetical protein
VSEQFSVTRVFSLKNAVPITLVGATTGDDVVGAIGDNKIHAVALNAFHDLKTIAFM